MDVGEEVGKNFPMFQVGFDGRSISDGGIGNGHWQEDLIEISIGSNHGFWYSDIGKFLPHFDPSL